MDDSRDDILVSNRFLVYIAKILPNLRCVVIGSGGHFHPAFIPANLILASDLPLQGTFAYADFYRITNIVTGHIITTVSDAEVAYLRLHNLFPRSLEHYIKGIEYDKF